MYELKNQTIQETKYCTGLKLSPPLIILHLQSYRILFVKIFSRKFDNFYHLQYLDYCLL